MLPTNTIFVAPPSMSFLAKSIAVSLGHELIIPEIIHFADGEIEVQLSNFAHIKGKPVCIIQSTNHPVQDMLIQLMLLAHELSNAGALSITALIPYFGYARHDGKSEGEQGSVALIAKLLHAAGINNCITVEIHNQALLSSLALPIHSISLVPFIAEHIKQILPSLEGVCLVAPDQGAYNRVQEIARLLRVDFISFTKERCAIDKTYIVSRQGSCKGVTAIIIDDIVDTGGTVINVCQALHAQGYTTIYGYFVHPVLSKDALVKLTVSNFNQIFVSNSIPLHINVPKIKIFDIAKVICEVLTK